MERVKILLLVEFFLEERCCSVCGCLHVGKFQTAIVVPGVESVLRICIGLSFKSYYKCVKLVTINYFIIMAHVEKNLKIIW
jgi:hypothetical protein